jgi:hypothetical protein
LQVSLAPVDLKGSTGIQMIAQQHDPNGFVRRNMRDVIDDRSAFNLFLEERQ